MSKTEYFYTYECHAKQKWISRPLIDVLVENYTTRPREYFEEAIRVGAITVNDRKVLLHYRINHNDLIKHLVHQHEPEQPDIPKLYENEDICVVNKPAGIPCHPVGPYHYYTVTKTLFGDRKVGCVNRLDMPVSGVLILNVSNSNNAHKMLKNANKVYIAKVKGQFELTEAEMAQREIQLENGYYCVNKKIGESTNRRVQTVTEQGKESKTLFKLVEYKNGHSLVECRPITGRTHQIRVHISWLGFPIQHDLIYGDYKPIEFKGRYDCDADITQFENRALYEFVVKKCPGSRNRTHIIKDEYICLHAWKYFYGGHEFVASLPDWSVL